MFNILTKLKEISLRNNLTWWSTMRRSRNDRNHHGQGRRQRRTGKVLVCKEKRQTKSHLCLKYLLLRQAESSCSLTEGVGRGELPIPPMNYIAWNSTQTHFSRSTENQATNPLPIPSFLLLKLWSKLRKNLNLAVSWMSQDSSHQSKTLLFWG